MSNKQKHTAGEWIVDPIADAHGYNTVRIADGSINGNTDEEPIATVYKDEDAKLIAGAPKLLQGVQDTAWQLRQMADEAQEPLRTKLLDMATELGLLDEQATA